MAIPFILWDAWFTSMGVWWFNTDYTIGVSLLGLPLEEWLFFWCIPFSCVFTYYCFDRFFNLTWTSAEQFAGLHQCGGTGSRRITVSDRIYTLLTAIVTLLTLLYLHFIAKKEWIGQASLLYLVLMPGFFAVNGVLTGTGLSSPIVNYNPNHFMNFRIGTIPIEDAVYGYSLFLLNIYFFKRFTNPSSHAQTGS